MKLLPRYKPGHIGKILRDIIPEKTLFKYKFLRDWYDSNPYRIFDGNDDDRRGNLLKDILVAKNYETHKERPIIIIDGTSAISKDNKIIYQYNATLYFDSNNSRISKNQSLPKSYVEKNFKKFSTINDFSEKSLSNILDEVIKYYSLPKKSNDNKLSPQDINYLVQNYANYQF